MKRSINLVVYVMMALAVALCGYSGNAEAKKYRITVASHHPESHEAIKTLKQIKEKLAKASNGELDLRIYPGGQLGDYTLIYEEVMRGTIQMAHIAIPSQYDEKIEMNFIPYLFENYDQLKDVFAPGSYFFDKYTQIHKKQGVKLLGIYAEGFIGFGTKTLPREYANPLVSKKELIRVPPMDVYKLTTEDMGYKTTTIPYSDLFSAIQTGVADGWIGGSPELNYLSFRDAIKYFIPYNPFMENTGYFINDTFFQSLPGTYQKLICDAFQEAAVQSYTACKAADEFYLKKLEEYGIKIVTLTDAERKVIADHVRKTTWLKLNDKFGADVMEKLKADLK